jgi:hypothetical protein
MDVVGLSGDDHQSSDPGAASDAPEDTSDESPSVIVMCHEASPRRQSVVEFSASCSDSNNGYEFHALQPIRGKDGRTEQIIVPQAVRAGMTERNASLERHLVTIQTLPNTAWRMAPAQNERGLILQTIFWHDVTTKKNYSSNIQISIPSSHRLVLLYLSAEELSIPGWNCSNKIVG